MNIVSSILILLEAICCLLLIGIILLQKSKSQGLGLAFGSGMGETLFGARAGNVLTKATVILGVIFMVNTVALAFIFSGGDSRSVMGKRLQTMPAAPQPAQQADNQAQQTPVNREEIPLPGEYDNEETISTDELLDPDSTTVEYETAADPATE